MKTFYIKTYGCQMNEYDSEYISAILREKNCIETDEPDYADYIILNTCNVRERAKTKVLSEIGRLKKIIKNRKTKIGVCGCVAQNIGTELMNKFDSIYFVVGTNALLNLPNIIERVDNGEKIIDISLNENKFAQGIFQRKNGVSTFVSIMKGCDNFCSYCIVPFVRGREISRKPKEIIDEIKYLIDLGYKEITLLGQNVNSYGKNLDETVNFPKFLYMVNNLNGLERIRFVTSHPKDFNEELIGVMKDCDKVCEHVHLPLQSGSDRILEMMNRKYTYKEYMSKIEMLKKYLDNVAITSDFIVGFPEETIDDFNKTLRAIREIEYHTVFSFIYSPRPGTKAAELTDSVDKQEKKRRLDELIKLQSEITYKINKSYEGKITNVLIEGNSKKDPNMYMGRNRQNLIVNFSSDKVLCQGSQVNVSVTEGKKNTLFGTFIN